MIPSSECEELRVFETTREPVFGILGTWRWPVKEARILFSLLSRDTLIIVVIVLACDTDVI